MTSNAPTLAKVKFNFGKIHVPQALLTFLALVCAVASQLPACHKYSSLLVALGAIFGGGGVTAASVTPPVIVKPASLFEETQP